MTRHTLHEVATVTYINWLTKKIYIVIYNDIPRFAIYSAKKR